MAVNPRDDIAGLIERLREVERAELDVASQADCRPEDTANYVYAGTCREAATQLDSLQARVMELTSLLSTGEDLRRQVKDVAEQWQARATRLQQERDEAYERAAKVAENPGFIEAQDTDWDLGVNFAKGFIAAAIRRLAGPEKEGK